MNETRNDKRQTINDTCDVRRATCGACGESRDARASRKDANLRSHANQSYSSEVGDTLFY